MNTIFSKVNQCKKQQLPFVVFRKPNSPKLVGIFQENDNLNFSEDFKEKGFVFAPFDSDAVIIFPLELSEVKLAETNNSNLTQASSIVDEASQFEKESFVLLVQKGIKSIGAGLFNKVVLSRKEEVAIGEFDIDIIFNKILDLYPTAFCYCWYHPKVGLWFGATPETLLQSQEDSFSTMALAGTQPYKGEDMVVWQNKEKDEQEFVTNFIIENLKNSTNKIHVSKPYTTRAGNLLHLKTDIKGVLKPESSLKIVIDILHPTPAVCGLPKQVAKDFIIENEGYDREFYTGFLGELNYDFNTKSKASNLYVNLRCMKIENKKAHLFIGCGITKNSNPEAEWQESVNKSQIMKRVL
jgi:isochorismate synthase